jgi:glycosyltransferase involved in cell wall biosynthesis
MLLLQYQLNTGMEIIPAISIVTATYNVAGYIGQSIHSALAQTFRDFELIVLDDGSTDGTLDAVRQISDPRIRLEPRPHQGAPASLADGVALARAPYLAFLDGDDFWNPNKLERHVRFLNSHPEVDLTFSWSRIVDEFGRDTGLTSRLWNGSISCAQLLADNVIGNGSSPVLRRSALLAAGGIDATFPGCYDLDAWLRMSLIRSGNLVAIPEFLTFYRRRPGQLTADVPMMERSFDRLIEKIRALASEDVARAEKKARSNMQRFFAYGRYQADDYSGALRTLARSIRQAPGAFLCDSRNWKMAAATLAGLVLPQRVHGYLTRAALRTKRA